MQVREFMNAPTVSIFTRVKKKNVASFALTVVYLARQLRAKTNWGKNSKFECT
jgi:hypothetical protein